MATDAAIEPATRPSRPWWGPVMLAAFVALVVCGYIATAVAPRWALTNPEGLLLLHSRVRHLLLALGNDIPFWSYVAIASFRLTLAFVVCHLIGRAYADIVLFWFGRYLGVTHQSIDAMEQGFDKADWLIVPFFVGSNIVAAITGMRRMPPVRLAVFLVVGLAARLTFWYWIAQIFDDELDKVLDFIAKYQMPALIVSIVGVVVVIGLNLRRGRNF